MTRKLLLHHRDELLHHLVHLIAREEVGNFTAGEDVVEILEERLLLDVVVGEDESHPFTLYATTAKLNHLIICLNESYGGILQKIKAFLS